MSREVPPGECPSCGSKEPMPLTQNGRRYKCVKCGCEALGYIYCEGANVIQATKINIFKDESAPLKKRKPSPDLAQQTWEEGKDW